MAIGRGVGMWDVFIGSYIEAFMPCWNGCLVETIVIRAVVETMRNGRVEGYLL